MLFVLHEIQKERGDRNVPTAMLWGRVCRAHSTSARKNCRRCWLGLARAGIERSLLTAFDEGPGQPGRARHDPRDGLPARTRHRHASLRRTR